MIPGHDSEIDEPHTGQKGNEMSRRRPGITYDHNKGKKVHRDKQLDHAPGQTTCHVCDARARGLSLQEIADAIGISHTTVRTHTIGIVTPRERAHAEAKRLLAAGLPYREITERTGIFPSQLAIWNKREQLSHRLPGNTGNTGPRRGYAVAV
jgi:DNA-binding CsgD family transcriptional regulator